jgi:hypothetical protein
MGLIRLIVAPIRSIVRFPLFQLGVVVAIILFLQAADDNSLFGQIFNALDKLVDASVRLFSELFEVKSFTRSGLTAGLMIAYVYLVCLLILFVLRIVIRAVVDLLGWSNAFGLRNTIARGCRSSALGRPIFLKNSGKPHSPGRPTIGRPIRRSAGGSCTAF